MITKIKAELLNDNDKKEFAGNPDYVARFSNKSGDVMYATVKRREEVFVDHMTYTSVYVDLQLLDSDKNILTSEKMLSDDGKHSEAYRGVIKSLRSEAKPLFKRALDLAASDMEAKEKAYDKQQNLEAKRTKENSPAFIALKKFLSGKSK
ncbi:MAG: hypothetical protein NC218_05300 [Acetobacter sp.]|nr:hypothetical protein [Acetobacter sp.]